MSAAGSTPNPFASFVTPNASTPAPNGLFGGASAQNNAGAGGGLFGNTGAQPAPNAGGGLFGGAGNQASGAGAPTGAGLFGNTATQAPAGGLFGGAGASTTGTTGGLFGGANANASGSGGGLFGSTNTAQPGGGLFGSTNTTTQPATGGLFGAASTNTTQPSGGLFGSTNAQPAGTLFGQSTTQPSTSMFGSTNTNTGGGLFGQSTAGGGLFGQQSTQQPNQPNAQVQPRPTGSLFGSTARGTFASTLAPPPSLGLSVPGGHRGALGTSAGGSYVPPPGGAADPAAQFAALVADLEAVKRAWDASGVDCAFQHYFYNLVDPAHVNLYGRPPNATNEVLWQKAVRENPDPTCMVPVLALGFDDLQQRADAQTQQATAHQQKLEELKKRVAALRERHSLSNAPRVQRAQATQAQLDQRLVALLAHLHLLIPSLRASALRPEEEALGAALDALATEVRGPPSGGAGRGGAPAVGRLRARLNELWALVGAAAAAKERGGGPGKDGRWAVVDEDGLKEIVQVLNEHQAGLAHLTRVLQKDLRDLAVIEGTEIRDDNGRVTTPVDALAASMRASVLR